MNAIKNQLDELVELYEKAQHLEEQIEEETDRECVLCYIFNGGIQIHSGIERMAAVVKERLERDPFYGDTYEYKDSFIYKNVKFYQIR